MSAFFVEEKRFWVNGGNNFLSNNKQNKKDLFSIEWVLIQVGITEGITG